MASSSSRSTHNALRTSSSYGNIHTAAISTALGGGISSSAAPRDNRRERRAQTASGTTPSAFSTSSGISKPYSTLSSPPGSKAALEESYLAAKRRANRQSYFEHYPERGLQRPREKRQEDEGEQDELQKVPAMPKFSVPTETFPSSHARIINTNDEIEGGESSLRDFGPVTTLRKSLSVGASTSSSTSLTTQSSSRRGKGREDERDRLIGRDRERGEPLVFPSMQSSSKASSQIEYSSLYSRAPGSSASGSRSLATPKSPNHPYGAFRDEVPALRFSNSTYSGDTPSPPQTPIETGLRSSLDSLNVVVAAPIPGVEAMDALVDGMDGSDDDDLFKRLPSTKKHGHSHHPLYAPPLPSPPPGVVLGRPSKESLYSELEDEEIRDCSTVLGPPRTSSKRRYGVNRTASSGTIIADVAPKQSPPLRSVEPTPTPPTIDEIIRKHNVTQIPRSYAKPKAVVPSISEIIRKNTPSNSRPSTEPSSRTSSRLDHDRQDISVSESEPEPLSPAEEAELVARSSIDSVAAEVQQTLLAHQAANEASGKPTAVFNNSHNVQEESSNRYSYYSYKTSRSAPSTSGCDQSIKSGSASISNGKTTSGIGSPPLDPETDFDLRALQQGGGQKIQSKHQSSQRDTIATYLRSARITTLLKLTRHPHASPEQPLTVSLSDLGSPTGFPLVVFLGLGCVRYVMGLYDEMAECLGIRLITIDRWGLGRTDVPPSSASRGVPEWSSVVDEVLDRMNIDKCSVMAHSAGAPYALSFANRYPERIIGEICLLAPWVGGGAGGGYRWLKYVPNGILKTAQAAEWKIQAWMIGKPPKITYEAIGYNVKAPVSSSSYNNKNMGQKRAQKQDHSPIQQQEDCGSDHDEALDLSTFRKNQSIMVTTKYPYSMGRPVQHRPSESSGNTFSDYDDLADFGGRFDSRTTFEQSRRSRAMSADGHSPPQPASQEPTAKKKSSRGFLRIWKGNTNASNIPPVPPLPSIEATLDQQPTQKRKLKTLKSIGSLRNKNGNNSITPPSRPQTMEKSPVLPQQSFDTSLALELDSLKFEDSHKSDKPSLEINTKTEFPRRPSFSVANGEPTVPYSAATLPKRPSTSSRAGGRRSISFTASSASYSFLSRPQSTYSGTSRAYSNHSSTPPASMLSKKPNESYQVALGNALIAASHAESSRGTHPDLLQILNHEQKPWGFSYTRYPHHVRVWYGDRDERIASNAVCWMENAMGADRCRVTVVKGADHGLMYRTTTVVDVLEQVLDFWSENSRREPSSPYSYGLSSDPFMSL